MKVNFQFLSHPDMDQYACGGEGKLLWWGREIEGALCSDAEIQALST